MKVSSVTWHSQPGMTTAFYIYCHDRGWMCRCFTQVWLNMHPQLLRSSSWKHDDVAPCSFLELPASLLWAQTHCCLSAAPCDFHSLLLVPLHQNYPPAYEDWQRRSQPGVCEIVNHYLSSEVAEIYKWEELESAGDDFTIADSEGTVPSPSTYEYSGWNKLKHIL